MSKPRDPWWPYIKNVLRLYPFLKRELDARRSQSVTVRYNKTGEGSGAGRKTEQAALRELDPARQREYDAALADLSLSLGQTLAKAAGSSLDASGLFGAAAVQSTPQPQSVSDFWYGMFARDDYDSKENDQENIWQEWQSEWQHEESRVNWRGIIIWALVIYFLFFRRKRHRR